MEKIQMCCHTCHKDLSDDQSRNHNKKHKIGCYQKSMIMDQSNLLNPQR